MPIFKWISDWIENSRRRRRERDAGREDARALRRQVEAVVSATEPRIRRVKGYRRRLTPAVAHALAHCSELVEGLPGPFDLRADLWGVDPLATAYFAGVDEMREALSTCPLLRSHFGAAWEPAAYVLLTMAPEEKKVFGAGISGETMQRDVQRLSVNFSGHRFTSPNADLPRLKEDLRGRAFHFLLTCALEKIAALRQKEERLDREQEILEMQWRLQQSREKGLHPAMGRSGAPAPGDAGRRILSDIDEELQDVRARLDEPSDYLGHVVQVLLEPARYLAAETVEPRLSRMGIKVKKTDPDPGHPIPYAQIRLGQDGRKMAGLIGRVSRHDVMDDGKDAELREGGI